MRRLHATLIPPLPAGIPDDRPVALMVRHGERPPIPDGSMGTDLEATADGAVAARALGALLGRRIVSARTSAILRCVQTAAHILAGAGLALKAEEDPVLGVPSAFMFGTPLAEETVRRLGFARLCEHMIAGDEALPGMPHPEEGAVRMREHALEVADRPGLHLLVTHDAMIAATVARSWGRRSFGFDAFPEFLEAAAIWRDGERVLVAYRGECLPVPVARGGR